MAKVKLTVTIVAVIAVLPVFAAPAGRIPASLDLERGRGEPATRSRYSGLGRCVETYHAPGP